MMVRLGRNVGVYEVVISFINFVIYRLHIASVYFIINYLLSYVWIISF